MTDRSRDRRPAREPRSRGALAAIWAAAAVFLALLALLAVRVHEEEALLFELPGYAEHFAAKRRFIPLVI